MKTSFAFVVAVVCAVAPAVLARDQAAEVRVHMSKHSSATMKRHHDKLYVAPLGEQCAYDPANDPSLYPCRDLGVCVRLNETYGECLTQEQAAQLPTAGESLAIDILIESDSESGSGSGISSESGSGSGLSTSYSGSYSTSSLDGDEDDLIV